MPDESCECGPRGTAHLTAPPPASAPQDHGIQIVVLDRGFVYVGRVATDADWCYLTDAQNIRRWGTSRGLGELAENGPTQNTKLDKTGSLQAPLKSIIHFIAVQEQIWEKLL
jgi:hypothetical protein